jgi:hypothetical protein
VPHVRIIHRWNWQRHQRGFQNPVWRARASPAFARQPEGARAGSPRVAHGAGMPCCATCTAKARSAGEARHPDVLSSGDSSLDKQRRVTQGAGAEPPAHSF